MLLTRRDFWAAALAGCSLPAHAARGADPMLPPAVTLAREAPRHPDPAGFLVSEKLDGVRAVWDGRQLRFRSGREVVAPPGFVARLPPVALDGELWLGRGAFESVCGLVRRERPDDAGWRALRYCVFDLPGSPGPFAERARRLAALARGSNAFAAVEQRSIASASALKVWLDEVVTAGGEGLMLHRADAVWQPGRSDALLKLKPQQDAEAVVVGHVGGHGRHEGRMGALRVRADDGTEFLLGTGFSDAERAAPPAIGSVVSYRYRGLTAAGVPRFASFLRVREF